MTSNDELDARVTALEHEVRAIREDAAAARVLAGGADRDVSAMQATLREHTTKLDSHSAKLDSHSAKLDMHKALLDSLRETQVEHIEETRRGFAMLAIGQAEILALLSRPDDPDSPG